MKFSLITVTMGDRPQLIARLKASLDAQTYRDFEWIVVDHKDHPEFKGGLSRARNFGIERATGDILGFPDDDAWYGPDLLESVSVMLADPENDGVSFRVVDEHGNCSAGGWMSAGKKTVTKSTVWHTVVSCSFFVKRKKLGNVRFDGGLGVGSGTRFGSGEETDFVLRLIENGAKIIYDGSKCVCHPMPTGKTSVSKGWLYGNGYGLVLRMHHYSLIRVFWAIGVQAARAVQAVLQLRFKKAAYHIAMAAGRFAGYFTSKREMRNR
jgi:glycosyltransferase involved in cell wall biosynthesis